MRTVVYVLATLVVLATRHPLLADDGKTPAAWGSVTVRDRSIAPGTKEKLTFVPFRTFEGGYLDTPVWVARGARPGRALCVVGGIHGDELNGPEIARRVFAATDPTQLSGTLIVLPAVNAHGFRTGNRYMPDRRDLNRVFPGNANGSVASIVAHHVFEIVREHCQALVDLHTGSDQRANLPQIRVDLGNAVALELAKHFGVGVILGGAGPRHSLRRETMEAGIPAIIYEAGEPLRFQQEEVQKGVAGVQNVMAYLGLVSEDRRRAAAEPGVRPHRVGTRADRQGRRLLPKRRARRAGGEGRRPRDGDPPRYRRDLRGARHARWYGHWHGGAAHRAVGLRALPPRPRRRVAAVAGRTRFRPRLNRKPTATTPGTEPDEPSVAETAPAEAIELSGKKGAGARIRTADLLITKSNGSRPRRISSSQRRETRRSRVSEGLVDLRRCRCSGATRRQSPES